MYDWRVHRRPPTDGFGLLSCAIMARVSLRVVLSLALAVPLRAAALLPLLACIAFVALLAVSASFSRLLVVCKAGLRPFPYQA